MINNEDPEENINYTFCLPGAGLRNFLSQLPYILAKRSMRLLMGLNKFFMERTLTGGVAMIFIPLTANMWNG